MKKITITIAVLALGAVAAIFAFAQMHKGGPMQHISGGVAGHHEKMVEHIASELKFTDEQKSQTKKVMADAKTRFAPIHAQLKETHTTSRDLGTNGVFDEKQAGELAARRAEIIKQGLIEMERTKAAIFAIMTADQKVQAKKMIDHMMESFEH